MKNRNISISFGIISYLFAFLPHYWLKLDMQYGLARDNFFMTTVAPTLPWILCIYLSNKYRDDKLSEYWWIIPSFLICFAYVGIFLFWFLCWSIKGFAP
jgi:hypothetical protein